ncbi:unnamed protein product [Effrenium voratum]|nr:unnamed protein product [Effrenium voratum]
MEGHVLRGKRTFIGIPVDSDEETEPSKPCVRRFFQAKVHKVLAVRWFTKRLRKHPARRSCLADAPTPDEKVLLGKVLSSRQLMQRTTEMLQEFQREILGVKGFFDELGVAPEDVHPDVSQSLDRKEAIMRLAVKVIHKAKWLSLRTCYNDHMKYQEQELRILKQQHAQLQNQFATVRQDYLHEVAILRDQARVRGELGSEWDDSGDVVYFFDPVKALSPKEAEFMLAAVKEKVMMILEHNPKLGGVDMGQLEKLKEMKESRETEELRAALVQRGHELAQAEKSLAALREENGRNGVAKLSSAHEQMFAELEDKISQLRFEANALRTSSAREIKERQKTEKRLEVKSEECEELREALQRAELDRGSLQLEASQLKSQLEVAREENLDLHERENALQAQLAASFDANDALKKVVTRQRAIKDIAAEVSEASQESSEEGSEDLNLLEDFMDRELPAFTRPDSSAPTSRASRPENERLEELLHEAHQQLLEAWQQKEQQLHRAEELKLENAQLQRKLDKQSRGMLVMHAEANASGTTELAQFMQNLRQKLGSPRMDSPKSKDDVSMAFPELEKQLEEASQEAEASLKAVLGALQRFKRQEAGDIQSLQQESLSCQQKKQQLERQLMELRMSRLSKFKAKNGQKLQSLVPVCLQMLEDLSAKMQQLASENVALRQGLLSVSSNLGEATSVMKASASAKGDKDLQRFLHTVSSNVEQVPTVFNRLFNEGRKRDQRMEQQAHERRQSMMHSMLVHLSDDRADSKEDPRTTPKVALPDTTLGHIESLALRDPQVNPAICGRRMYHLRDPAPRILPGRPLSMGF